MSQTTIGTELKFGTIGCKLSPGEVVLSVSGRRLSPFPTIKFGSSRMVLNTLKRVDVWLIENALVEAQNRGDDFNARSFAHARTGKVISQSDKDWAEEYLFGEQPAVLNSFLKPLAQLPN